MPAGDSLQPPLTPAEREIVKVYGGWTNFMNSYLLKPGNDDDDFEAKQIIKALASQNSGA